MIRHEHDFCERRRIEGVVVIVLEAAQGAGMPKCTATIIFPV